MSNEIKLQCSQTPTKGQFSITATSLLVSLEAVFSLVTQRGEERCVTNIKTAARETTSLPTAATLFGPCKYPYIHSDFNLPTTATYPQQQRAIKVVQTVKITPRQRPLSPVPMVALLERFNCN